MVKKTKSEGIHAIANTEIEDRQADIVFIHGLRGGSHSTWRHGKVGKQEHFFWPEGFGIDLPNCGIWSVGYPAGLTELGKPGMIIEERASNISLRLANAGLGDRPLFFVTHSMGGLIVKSLIVDSQTLPDKDRKRIAAMVRGIVFCGTPHRGAVFADAAVVLGKFFGGSQDHVKEMRANAVPLDTLHDKFIEWHRKCPVPVDSYAEKIGLFRNRWFRRPLPLGLVVPRASANPNIAGHTVHPVDEDHLSMVKPSNREHDVYAGVKRFISDALAAGPITAQSDPGPAQTDQASVREPTRGDWLVDNQYLMPPHFTGRVTERTMLSKWLATDEAHPLFSLRALGGFGKSALVWHWLMNDVTPATRPRVVWWGFYGSEDVRFDNFVTRTLAYLTDAEVKETKPTINDVRALVNELHQDGTLLVLDGFERELRAYCGLNAAYQGDEAETKESDRNCVSPLAETFLRDVATLPDIRSKVLLTTRLSPHALETRNGELLEGCLDKELYQMHPDDAVEYFRAKDIHGTRTEIQTACAPYGYHPLRLSLLAGLIVKDLQKPRDIAAAVRLDVSDDPGQSEHHVLEIAYDSLTPERRALLSRIACFRNPVTLEALRELAEAAEESITTIDSDLQDLIERGLLNIDTEEKRFDLHPIVRRYAYDRLGATDRAAAHTKLRDYFAGVPTPDEPTCLEDLNPVIELYHHTVRAGQFDEACELFHGRITEPLYFQFGAYQLCIDLLGALFPDGEENPPGLKTKSAQAWTLNTLAISYSLSDQPRRSLPLFERQSAIRKEEGNSQAFAAGLGNVSEVQLKIGALRDAEARLYQSLALCSEKDDEFCKAVGHQHLGLLLAYRGAYAESMAELATALSVFETLKVVQSQGIIWAYRALCELHQRRSNPESADDAPQSAFKSARRALELADEWQEQVGRPNVRDYVRAHWLLGVAHRVAGQHDQAERKLHEALERCRRINHVHFEAEILIDLARLRAATGNHDEARKLAEDALLITERSGYVLQGADAHLELAKLALASGDKTTALDHARQARDLATCDGPPDYTYHAAYTEAGRLLEELES